MGLREGCGGCLGGGPGAKVHSHVMGTGMLPPSSDVYDRGGIYKHVSPDKVIHGAFSNHSCQ